MMTLLRIVIGMYLELGVISGMIWMIKNWNNIEFRSWRDLFTSMAKMLFAWPVIVKNWICSKIRKQEQ